MLGVKSDENSQVTRSSLKGLYITPKSLDFILEDSGEPLKYCLAEKCLQNGLLAILLRLPFVERIEGRKAQRLD